MSVTNISCREAERMIPGFIEESLNDHDLKAFLNHIDTCPECMEELSIQLLVIEGLDFLEEGKAFALQKVLDEKIESALRKLSRKHRISVFLAVFEIFAALILAFGILYLFMIM